MSELKNKRKSIFSRDYIFYDFVKATSVPGYVWFRPKVLYASKKAKKHIEGGALVISNHVAFTDPAVLMYAIWYRRHHFICIKDLFEGKLGPLFRGFHCIPIDRENFGMDSFRTITDHLKNDEIVTMFPEGHISESNGLEQFKSGMILMSIMSGKPIVPVYIKKREHFYERSIVAIGEPVDIVSIYGARPNMVQINEATKKLHDIEEDLIKLVNKRK